ADFYRPAIARLEHESTHAVGSRSRNTHGLWRWHRARRPLPLDRRRPHHTRTPGPPAPRFPGDDTGAAPVAVSTWPCPLVGLALRSVRYSLSRRWSDWPDSCLGCWYRVCSALSGF